MLAIAMTLAASCQAQNYTTIGDPDCGKWVTQPPGELVYRAWLGGYLNGLNGMYNSVAKNKVDALGKLGSMTQAYLWMDNWCKANPLSTVGAGGMSLFIELVKR
jgi:hypothetical protein